MVGDHYLYPPRWAAVDSYRPGRNVYEGQKAVGFTIGETDDSVDDCVFPRAGIHSFHAATMFQTEVRGERGDVCSQCKDETVGVMMEDAVVLLVSVKDDWILIQFPLYLRHG